MASLSPPVASHSRKRHADNQQLLDCTFDQQIKDLLNVKPVTIPTLLDQLFRFAEMSLFRNFARQKDKINLFYLIFGNVIQFLSESDRSLFQSTILSPLFLNQLAKTITQTSRIINFTSNFASEIIELPLLCGFELFNGTRPHLSCQAIEFCFFSNHCLSGPLTPMKQYIFTKSPNKDRCSHICLECYYAYICYPFQQSFLTLFSAEPTISDKNFYCELKCGINHCCECMTINDQSIPTQTICHIYTPGPSTLIRRHSLCDFHFNQPILNDQCTICSISN